MYVNSSKKVVWIYVNLFEFMRSMNLYESKYVYVVVLF
jgi:hypothetical protein